MTPTPKLTTAAACRVAKLPRDRFNENVASGLYPCAPPTIPGRARLFDPDDMLSLRLFRDLLEDGFSRERAGLIACNVGQAARQHPEANAITFVEHYTDPVTGDAFPADMVPDPAQWETTVFSGQVIRKATTFNVSFMRKMIARDTEEERAIIGEPD